MNHAITIGDVLLSLAALLGLAFMAFGALGVFAAGMSDDPSAAKEVGKQSCTGLLFGALLVAGGIYGLLA